MNSSRIELKDQAAMMLPLLMKRLDKEDDGKKALLLLPLPMDKKRMRKEEEEDVEEG